MGEIRSWVTGVLAAVTVAIALGAGVQIARADVAEPATVVVQTPSSATTSGPVPTTTTPASTTTTPARTTTKAPRTTTTTRTTTSVDISRCTNRIDYSDDPRDNATINSIGADTGRCPTPIRAEPVLVGNDRSMRDANGETYAEACRRMGYEPGPSCPAG